VPRRGKGVADEGEAADNKEREREGATERTRHGNGKWDAAEYRWTLTGMRVRITGCHPYSAGLAAVSGQCYRYISIITFGRAAQRSAAFRSLACASARISASVSRDPICIATCPVQTPVTASVTAGFNVETRGWPVVARRSRVLQTRKSGKIALRRMP